MRALICDDYSGVDGLRVGDLPEPEMTPETVLIEVGATAVNFADTLMVAGQYQVRPEPPFAPGYEMSGMVIDPADSNFAAGTRVCGFVPFGAMAERVVVPSTNLTALPDGIGFDVGSVLPATYGTSYHALVDRARIEPGESLLVLGAAGGVGLAAVQIGRALGARVIAAVSSDEKAELSTSSGADEVIRYDLDGLRDGIARIVGSGGVDVVFDAVGGEATEQALRSTAWNGRLLVVGFAAGVIPSIPLNLVLLKGNSLVGVFWGRFSVEEPDRTRTNLARIIELVETAQLNPFIQRSFDLDGGAEAMSLVANRKSLGRVVIAP